jgi:hypothetical protein
VSKRIFPLISQIGINYRHASLSEHTDDESDHVKAGDRLPYFELDGQSIFARLQEPKFHLLLFSKSTPATECDQFTRTFGDVADCYAIPISDRVREIFEREADFAVFLRPDNHIAFMSSQITADMIRDYLHSRHIEPQKGT